MGNASIHTTKNFRHNKKNFGEERGDYRTPACVAMEPAAFPASRYKKDAYFPGITGARGIDPLYERIHAIDSHAH